MTMKKMIFRAALLAVALTAMMSSCQCGKNPEELHKKRDVMLFYVAGYNDLGTPYLQPDIEDLVGCNYLPGNAEDEDVVLVFSKIAKTSADFTTPVQPVIFRIYKDKKGQTVCDTLKRWEPSVLASSASGVRDVLTFVKNSFPARSYGMVFSSHATGWVPEGYYSHPTGDAVPLSVGKKTSGIYRKEQLPGMPAVKSVGREYTGTVLHEIDIQDFADAIPYKLDYLLMDACLMGGVETAWALRGKTRLYGGSQTEVLADGFNYTTLTQWLCSPEEPDPLGVCTDYFTQYDQRTGINRSATFSLIDCDKLDALGTVCQDLFPRYRDAINALAPSAVQGYGRYHNSAEHPWYFDLQDILVQAGAANADLQALKQALDACVLYNAATPAFLKDYGGFDIRTHCGLSMYLPSAGNATLNAFYKKLAWNQAAKLVE